MPDMTLCTNNDCPMQKQCKRHSSHYPSQAVQSMRRFEPKPNICDEFKWVDHPTATDILNYVGNVEYNPLFEKFYTDLLVFGVHAVRVTDDPELNIEKIDPSELNEMKGD